MRKITFTEANNALQYICGVKAEDWLIDIKVSNRTARRKMILEDYMWNSHSVEGVLNLNTVLLYLAQLDADVTA